MRLPYHLGALLAVWLMASSFAHAAGLRLAPVFGDHMVLQREKPIHIHGHAEPKANIAVSLGSLTRQTVADDSGKWSVELDARPAGGPYVLTVSGDNATLTVRDILLGDVWLCSGQSNMQFSLAEAVGHDAALASVAADPSVRLLMVPKAPADKPADGFDAAWKLENADAARRFSAVGIFFATALRQHDPSMREVPIGLIDSSFGGTRVEGWIASEALTTFKPEDLRDSMFGIKPSHLYNAMIAPLAGTGLKGVLWYQGEGNAGQPAVYSELLGTLIGRWRHDFRDGALPFYLVQLPNFPDSWDGYSFAWLRDAQAKVASSLDHVHLAVTIDTPDGHDLHPRHKAHIGDRLARLAARHTYGQDVVAEGPVFRSATPEGNAIRIDFDTVGAPLAIGPDPIVGFDVAGEDGVYFAARAERLGDHAVRVVSGQVPSPRLVRYAWRADPLATLYNREGLPAAPFRTDRSPPTNMVEVQPMPPARRIVTPTYSARIEADGRLASLQVGGQELLSPDDGGGFAALSGWGWKKFNDVADLGPHCVRYFDGGASVTYTFGPADLRITIANDADEALAVRFLLNPLATTADPLDHGRDYSFAREENRMVIAGADSVEKAFDVLYEVKAQVKPHASRELTLRLTKPAAK